MKSTRIGNIDLYCDDDKILCMYVKDSNTLYTIDDAVSVYSLLTIPELTLVKVDLNKLLNYWIINDEKVTNHWFMCITVSSSR